MSAIWLQLQMSLRLYYRNTMALIYGYIFPAIFLVAFWVLYRFERVPLARHMGELLTIAVLGGACFGLPTTIVSERERGVWRRYRLTPVPTLTLVGSTVLARYAILITAGLLQVGLAMAFGMPLPRHPLELFVVFSAVAFAFMGLGLVIAMLADTVPAVQALGQCIFLPMLIIGGIAVQLSSLPDWALHLSAFFPGRYAVEAIQACVTGPGIGTVGFALLALVIIGAAGSLAGARMFRWDAQQRFLANTGKVWLLVALAGWAAVGVLAEVQGRVGIEPAASAQATPAATPQIAVLPSVPAVTPELTLAPPAPAPPSSSGPTTGATPAAAASPQPAAGTSSRSDVPAGTTAAPSSAATPPPTAPAPASAPQAADAAQPDDCAPSVFPSWQAITNADIDRCINFKGLPPDGGVVTPIAPLSQDPDPELTDALETIRLQLPQWPPAQVPDLVQRVRNLLYVAAVPDVLQTPVEPYVPVIVFAEIQRTVPKADLIKILFWIGVHWDQGSDAAIGDLQSLGISRGADIDDVRGRAAAYGVKLLGQLTGKRPAKF